MNKANEYYRAAKDGELGALIVNTDERPCLDTGECQGGDPCQVYLTAPDPVTGAQKLGNRCDETGGSIYYIVLTFGNTCRVDEAE